MIQLPPPGLLLKQVLLLFWAMYFTMVAASNLVNWFGEIGVLDWTFMDSNNFEYLRSVVEIYGIGANETKALLFGAFAVEAVAAGLFWGALLTLRQGGAGTRFALYAVCWAVFVWLTFIFAVELFVAFDAESVFRELLAIAIATGIALVLIPDDLQKPA